MVQQTGVKFMANDELLDAMIGLETRRDSLEATQEAVQVEADRTIRKLERRRRLVRSELATLYQEEDRRRSGGTWGLTRYTLRDTL